MRFLLNYDNTTNSDHSCATQHFFSLRILIIIIIMADSIDLYPPTEPTLTPYNLTDTKCLSLLKNTPSKTLREKYMRYTTLKEKGTGAPRQPLVYIAVYLRENALPDGQKKQTYDFIPAERLNYYYDDKKESGTEWKKYANLTTPPLDEKGLPLFDMRWIRHMKRQDEIKQKALAESKANTNNNPPLPPVASSHSPLLPKQEDNIAANKQMNSDRGKENTQEHSQSQQPIQAPKEKTPPKQQQQQQNKSPQQEKKEPEKPAVQEKKETPSSQPKPSSPKVNSITSNGHAKKTLPSPPHVLKQVQDERLQTILKENPNVLKEHIKEFYAETINEITAENGSDLGDLSIHSVMKYATKQSILSINELNGVCGSGVGLQSDIFTEKPLTTPAITTTTTPPKAKESPRKQQKTSAKDNNKNNNDTDTPMPQAKKPPSKPEKSQTTTTATANPINKGHENIRIPVPEHPVWLSLHKIRMGIKDLCLSGVMSSEKAFPVISSSELLQTLSNTLNNNGKSSKYLYLIFDFLKQCFKEITWDEVIKFNSENVDNIYASRELEKFENKLPMLSIYNKKLIIEPSSKEGEDENVTFVITRHMYCFKKRKNSGHVAGKNLVEVVNFNCGNELFKVAWSIYSGDKRVVKYFTTRPDMKDEELASAIENALSDETFSTFIIALFDMLFPVSSIKLPS